eukprot:1162053-Pelagomonas_calceolata.AAC.3
MNTYPCIAPSLAHPLPPLLTTSSSPSDTARDSRARPSRTKQSEEIICPHAHACRPQRLAYQFKQPLRHSQEQQGLPR